jgi:hypothetical protein
MINFARLDVGLEALINLLDEQGRACMDYETLNPRISAISACTFSPSELDTIIDFATRCNYIERTDGHMILTTAGRQRAASCKPALH